MAAAKRGGGTCGDGSDAQLLCDTPERGEEQKGTRSRSGLRTWKPGRAIPKGGGGRIMPANCEREALLARGRKKTYGERGRDYPVFPKGYSAFRNRCS